MRKRVAGATQQHPHPLSTSNPAAARGVPVASVSPAPPASTPPSAELAQGPGWTLYRSRWEAALAEQRCDALIFDAPYSAGTHAAETTRSDGYDATSLTPDYAAFTEADIRAFCESWAPRCRGWMVSLTDSVLAPVWRAEMERVGRYAFAPVPCVLRAMSVRIQQDGPSSWAIYAMVSRPRTKEFSTWGILPGAYVGTGKSSKGERGGGRGKPQWLMQALVRDYSRPGALVADPFAGWGSTLAAAVALGRTAVGSEVDPAAFAEARRRLRRPLQVDLLAGLEVSGG